MKPREKDLLVQALLLPEERRRPWLDQACAGDQDLRRRVLQLLADQVARSTLLSPVVDADLADEVTLLMQPVDERPDRYRESGRLGEGGYGEVVACFDRSLRRFVAVKRPRPGADVAHELLAQEARLLAYLDHPGVVPVYERMGDSGGYAMKLLEGESLQQRLARLERVGDRMPLSEALRILSRVSETLAHAHSKGVMHLDVKPANVMLQDHGAVVLIDWGIARFFDAKPYAVHLERGGERTALRDTDGIAGTPLYMPPEQFGITGWELGPATDVYALGCVLFEMLAGFHPFAREGESVPLMAFRKAHDGPPDLAAYRPDLSSRLTGLCQRMLDPDPCERPPSCEAVLASLAELAEVGTSGPLRHLAAGDVLFEQGAAPDDAFQILEGCLSARIARPDGFEEVNRLGPGDIVGELALLSRKPRTATLVALLPTTVRALDWARIEDELEKVNPLVGRLLRALSDKLVGVHEGE